MSMNAYGTSATRNFMVALRDATPPLPEQFDNKPSLMVQQLMAKRSARPSVKAITISAWRLLSQWRQEGQPIKSMLERSASADEIGSKFGLGPFGFCRNVVAAEIMTLHAAFLVQRADESLADSFVAADELATLSFQLTTQMEREFVLGQLLKQQVPAALAGEQAEQAAAERFSEAPSFDQYMTEEVGPAIEIISGLAFVALDLLKKKGVGVEQRIERTCRILENSIPFVCDWAMFSTGAFYFLKRVFAFSTDETRKRYQGNQELLNSQFFQLAQYGTEFEHLELVEMFTAADTRDTVVRRLQEEESYRIGCGGLGIKPVNRNVVEDSVVWTAETFRIYGPSLKFDDHDY